MVGPWVDRPRPPFVGDERAVLGLARYTAEVDAIREALDGSTGD